LKELKEMAASWDIENTENDFLATGSSRNIYSEICDSIRILKDFKFEPYQPVPYPPKPDFIDRLKGWIKQFNGSDQKYMLYFSSKVIFLTHSQITYLIGHIFQNKIKKLILEDIILEKDLEPFSYKKAEEYFASELEKTLFVGLSDSSRLNDFTHVNREEINRRINTGIELETLLYPSKRRKAYQEYGQNSIIGKKIKICRDFEKEILFEDDLIKDKERLVILEDFSGSGSDIIQNFNSIKSSLLPLKKIIFAPYIITYKARKALDEWINANKDDKKYYYTYGTLIPEEAKCFDFDKSYLKSDWHDESIDICEKVKLTCKSIANKYFQNNPTYLYGFGKIKIAFANYYNCPDNSLPILWCDIGGWIPLFQRASRII
jgi:hypothetical protein